MSMSLQKAQPYYRRHTQKIREAQNPPSSVKNAEFAIDPKRVPRNPGDIHHVSKSTRRGLKSSGMLSGTFQIRRTPLTT
jgi:hypothetical protein